MMLIKEHDNYIKQSLDVALKSKPLYLRSPLLTCIPNSTWDKKQHDDLAKLLQVSMLTQEELNVLLAPWHRAKKLAELWGKINRSKSKERLHLHLKRIEQLKKEIDSNYRELNTLMTLLVGNEIFFHIEAIEELLGGIMYMNSQRGQPYNTDYFIRYAINSSFYIGKQIGLKADRSPSSIHKYIEYVTQRDQDTINQDYSDYKEIHKATNFLKNFSINLNPAIRFIHDPLNRDTQNILRSIRLRRIFKRIGLDMSN